MNIYELNENNKLMNEYHHEVNVRSFKNENNG
jgi:hypothetical protein